MSSMGSNASEGATDPPAPGPDRAYETPQAGHLVELLRWRAQDHGDELAYRFLTDGEAKQITVTYAELNAAANRIAHATLAARGQQCERVALLFQQGAAAIGATLPAR